MVATPTGGTSFVLYTTSQLNQKLGVSNVSAANTALFVMNGDYNAKTVYFLSCVQGNNWHVSDRNATNLGTTPMRVNVLIVYWG